MGEGCTPAERPGARRSRRTRNCRSRSIAIRDSALQLVTRLNVLVGLGSLRLDVGSVDALTLGSARVLVLDRPHKAHDVESEHCPAETLDGSDARAVLDEGAVLLGETVGGVAALEAVAEGGLVKDTGRGSKEDGTGEEHEGEDAVAKVPVGQAEQEVEDAGEEAGG